MRAKFIYLISLVAALFMACEGKDDSSAPASLSFDVQDATFFNGADGAINVTIEGGEEPFYFFWNTGVTSKDISGLAAGSYTLRVTYGKDGLSYLEGTAKVEQPGATPLVVKSDVVDASRYGKAQGRISLTVEGGTPPYSYSWSNGATSADLSDLYAGFYSVKVEDSSTPAKLVGEATIYVGEPDFVCGQDSIRDVNGNLYATVELNGMCWTVDNLITESKPEDVGSLIDGRFCKGDNCSTARGAHYAWNAMMNGASAASSDYDQVQGIAPKGWHIPTKTEWQDLQNWLKINGNGGLGTNVWTKVIGPNSPSGLNVLAAGNWGYGIYSDPNLAAFWTSTQNPNNPDEAEIVYLLENATVAFRRWFFTQRPKTYGLSVRLVQDREEE